MRLGKAGRGGRGGRGKREMEDGRRSTALFGAEFLGVAAGELGDDGMAHFCGEVVSIVEGADNVCFVLRMVCRSEE